MSVNVSDQPVVSLTTGDVTPPPGGVADPNGSMLNAAGASGWAGGAADPNANMINVVQVDDNSDQAISADIARADFGVDGTGLKIGVLSDSFNVLGGYNADIANGNLPNNVTVVAEGPAGSTDEGRSMCELVYKDAPGAKLYFATAEGGQTAFANNIAALQAAGCNIILDDITYFAEPFYQMGDAIDTAIANFVAAGGTYVTCAANNGNGFYESAFNPIVFNLPTVGLKTVHDFGGGNPYEQVTLANDTGTTDFALEWAQPFKTIGGGPGSNDSLSFYVFDQNKNFLFSVNTSQVGSDPVQTMFMNDLNGAVRYVAIADDAGPAPSLFKFVSFADGNGTVLDGPGNGVGSGAITGHNEDPNAITAAAVNYTQTPRFGTSPPVVEDFSNFGPGELLFDQNGNPLPTPQFLNKPDVAGPDGSATDPLNPFFGTSAATPNVGAVAALVLQENPSLKPRDIENLLEDSAIAMADPTQSGAGLVQADKAVQFASSQTITAFAGGNTTLLGTHLNDTFVADGHVITVAFTGPRAGYSIVRNADGSITITDNRSGSPDGTDKVIDVGFARFTDQTDNLSLSVPFDVSGDTISDLVFQSEPVGSGPSSGGGGGPGPNQGTPQIWLWNGSAVTSQATFANPGASWHIITAHDVNGDRRADLIWQNDNGTPGIWLMNGTTPIAEVGLTNPGTSWHLVSSGDTNGDGNSDLIWQNTDGTLGVWLMNGTTPVAEAGIGNPGANWKVIGAADFNADGRDDILLQNTLTGNLMIDLVNGTSIASTVSITVGDPSWHAVSTGMFNGVTEIAWQNSSGTPGIWLMNGTTPVAEAALQNPGPGWQIISVDHFTANGHADLLFQNSSGAMGLWELNGTNIVAETNLPNPGSSWQSVNGHPFATA
jgi:Subtilase family/FG-GAP-like repeat